MTLSEIYQKGAEILENKNLGFYLRGVETEYVMKHNEEIFREYRFVQSAIDSIEATTETRLLDVTLQVPIVMSSITAPIPRIQRDGLLKIATALKETGSMMWTGTPIPSNLRELVEVGVPLVQTVKPYTDRSKVMKMLSQAEAAGATWVGIEVDAGQGTKILDRQMAKDCSPMSVSELKELKHKISRPLVLKGILSPRDAEKALEAGADVIVVSNHGAHTIDYLPHPLEVLEEIAKVIANQIPIIIDGGFRRGTDVLKGLAFGAQAIGVGRPILYGLAADGEEGVKKVIAEMAGELKRAMTMTGVKDPASAHRGIIL
ncbi:MAG: alpha-hydroxy-acid oxidizing protein [Chloroflexi bacterium]|nr:alpha-hydroxy-acid oxidizing protein [Chloroflexota bacterium]